MELKAFLLCFAFFVVTVSGASLIDLYEVEADEPKKEAVSKYTLEVDDGKKKVDETIEIDTEKETETFHIPSDGDTSPSAPGDVKVVSDFKRKIVIQRMSNQKACFLSNSTESLPKPNDLQTMLEGTQASPSQSNAPTRSVFVVVGILTDRSILSDDMADLCKKFPIYLVKEDSLLEDAEKQKHRKRRKRCSCYYVNYRFCSAPGCCYWRCYLYCPSCYYYDLYYYNYRRPYDRYNYI